MLELVSFLIPFASLHFPHTGQNQINPGLVAEFRAPALTPPSITFAVGAYENSYRKTTAFGQAVWTPVKFATPLGEVAAGASIGIGTGYRSPVIGGAFVRLGPAHVTIIPPISKEHAGVLGFAFRIPVK